MSFPKAGSQKLQDEIVEVGGFYQRIVFPDGTVAGQWDRRQRYDWMTQGMDLAGKTAIDIGTMNGALMLYMEQAGAEGVLACDVDPGSEKQFALVKREFGLKAEYRALSVYDLEGIEADVVMMGGVYYHLKHPLLGIEKAWAATKEVLLIEGEIDLYSHGCQATFYRHQYKGDATNWWVPTLHCLLEWCASLDGVCHLEYLPQLACEPERAAVRIWRCARWAANPGRSASVMCPTDNGSSTQP